MSEEIRDAESVCAVAGAPPSKADWLALNGRQRVWLSAHGRKKPFRMAWLNANRRHASGPPETWKFLKAWWRHGWIISTLSIHDTDREALEPYFEPGTWGLSPRGEALLRAWLDDGGPNGPTTKDSDTAQTPSINAREAGQ